MSTIFSIWFMGNLYCLSGFKSHFQIIYSKLRKKWTGIILQFSLLWLVDLLTFLTANALGLAHISEKEYLIGLANHHNPCLGTVFNIRQPIGPWLSSVLSGIGLGAAEDLPCLAFGVNYEVLNRAVLWLYSAPIRDGAVSYKGMTMRQKPRLICPVNIFSYACI